MSETERPRRQLSLVDCTAVTVGIIIGSGIYESLGLVAAQASTAVQLAGFWLAGGVFALLGSLCYAELATRYPEEGGDYVYLTNAYGPRVGFLFAWTQLWIIRPGSIGAMACVFAEHATRLHSFGSASTLVYACGSIVLLTAVHLVGVRQGTLTQNILTAAKIVGLATLAIAGLCGTASEPPPTTTLGGDAAFAMIFVLFAYTGWNETGCVAAEVREPRKNLLRALLASTAIVTVVYLALNAACCRLLGLEGIASSNHATIDAATRVFGRNGARLMSLLICISALGSTNGMIFTGARIYYALGRRYPRFAVLARWSPRRQTPATSLVVQAAITLGLVVGFGGLSTQTAPRDAFGRLVIFTTPPFYLFLILSAAAVVLFRRRAARESSETFRMPFYPLPPLAVAATAGFMTYAGTRYLIENFHQHGVRLAWPAAWIVATLTTGALLALTQRSVRSDSDA